MVQMKNKLFIRDVKIIFKKTGRNFSQFVFEKIKFEIDTLPDARSSSPLFCYDHPSRGTVWNVGYTWRL